MDDKSLKDLESTLQIAKFAPKGKEPPSVQDILESIDADYKHLGDNIALLRERVGASDDLLEKASGTILDIIKTMRR